jgi:hypothetical protein
LGLLASFEQFISQDLLVPLELLDINLTVVLGFGFADLLLHKHQVDVDHATALRVVNRVAEEIQHYLEVPIFVAKKLAELVYHFFTGDALGSIRLDGLVVAIVFMHSLHAVALQALRLARLGQVRLLRLVLINHQLLLQGQDSVVQHLVLQRYFLFVCLILDCFERLFNDFD